MFKSVFLPSVVYGDKISATDLPHHYITKYPPDHPLCMSAADMSLIINRETNKIL